MPIPSSPIRLRANCWAESTDNSSASSKENGCKPSMKLIGDECSSRGERYPSSRYLSPSTSPTSSAIDPTNPDEAILDHRAMWQSSRQDDIQKNDNEQRPSRQIGCIRPRPKIANSVLDLIGNTPMVMLSKIADSEQPCAEIVAKLESNNPSNSVKDRVAYSMIKEAEKRGDIYPHHTTLVEPTSGNTGIGLSMVAARLGYRLILTMPEGMSIEKRVLLQAFGAEVVLTRNEDGMAGTIRKAEEIVESLGNDRAYLLQQFSNPDNPKVHRENTGPEIYHDTDGKVDILMAGVGTGGTLTGCAQFLKPLLPHLKVIAVEPSESPVLGGGKPGPHFIQGIGAGVIPANIDLDLVDEIVPVSSEEAIYTSRQLVEREGLFCGISSGAVVHAALQVGRRPENVGKRIVLFVPSFGERYLSTVLFEDLWEEAANMKA